MIKINYLIFICASLCLTTMSSQNKVCESSSNELVDMNTIGKCAIEEFKKSNEKEFVKIQTRNRFVRKRNNTYLKNLKKNLASSKVEKTVKIEKKTIDNSKVATTSVVKSSESLLKDFVRFDQVTDIPVFITCDETNMNAKNSCVKETFINTILDNFTYPFDAAAEGIEGTVWVRFIIDKEGYVKNVTTTGPENGTLLEEEAKRLVSFLPKFMPGKHNNTFVNVEYFMPIEFQLDE